MREVRRAAIQAQKNCKETLPRARRLTKEMLLYWKKYEKVEKEHRKRAEKEALEQRKLDEEMREVKLKLWMTIYPDYESKDLDSTQYFMIFRFTISVFLYNPIAPYQKGPLYPSYNQFLSYHKSFKIHCPYILAVLRSVPNELDMF